MLQICKGLQSAVEDGGRILRLLTQSPGIMRIYRRMCTGTYACTCKYPQYTANFFLTNFYF